MKLENTSDGGGDCTRIPKKKPSDDRKQQKMDKPETCDKKKSRAADCDCDPLCKSLNQMQNNHPLEEKIGGGDRSGTPAQTT